MGATTAELVNTLQNQAEFHNEVLRCHPDGLFTDSALSLGENEFYLKPKGGRWDLEEFLPSFKGPGILEAKSASNKIFDEFSRKGLPDLYLDQCQVNMHLTARNWTVCILISREDYSRIAFFLIPYDNAHYEKLQMKACSILSAVILGKSWVETNCQDQELDEDDQILQESLSTYLPAGDMKKGFCFECPLNLTCPEQANRRKSIGSFPPEIHEEIQALCELLKEFQESEKTTKNETEILKDRILELASFYEVSITKLTGELKSLSISEIKGKRSIDMDALERDFHEAYAKCLNIGEPYTQIRVTERK
jgi:hypothetical protein